MLDEFPNYRIYIKREIILRSRPIFQLILSYPGTIPNMTTFRFFLIFSLCLGCAFARFFSPDAVSFPSRRKGSSRDFSPHRTSFSSAGIKGGSFSSLSGARGFSGSKGTTFSPKFSKHSLSKFTVPGGPCDYKKQCSGDDEWCGHYIGREVCLVEREITESCDEWYHSCVKSVCRGKVCVADDNMADTGEVCTDDRQCMDGNECMPCSWVPGEKRCAKTIATGGICDGWFQTCAPTGVCTASSSGNKCVLS